MYAIGDILVYGTSGVCRVADITDAPMKSMEQGVKYYLLKPLFQEGIIYCPVTNTRVRIRPVISKEEANALIDTIPTIQDPYYQMGTPTQLSEYYQKVFSTAGCTELLELIMGLYCKKKYVLAQRRKFGQVDERYLKRAQTLLHGELAAALGLELNQVEDYITQRTGMTKE